MGTRFVNWLRALLSKLPHPIRWLIVVHVGFICIIAGIVMLIIPGPGILFIALGFTILSIEFTWAHQVMKNGEQWMERFLKRIKKIFNK